MSDISLYAIERGRGEPFLFLHGNGEDGTYFQQQIQYFSGQYRVIALDTRGHGRSPRGTAPFTIRQFAEDLHDFMDEKGIKKAHLLGFSDGGNIALTFALKYPERVNRLILNGANLNAGGVKLLVQLPIVLGYYITRLFAGHSAEARLHMELLQLMVKEPDIEPERLHGLFIKTLVIAGTRDMIKDSHTRMIYESLPRAQLALIPGDHFIAAKNPDRFNETVERFLMEEENV